MYNKTNMKKNKSILFNILIVCLLCLIIFLIVADKNESNQQFVFDFHKLSIKNIFYKENVIDYSKIQPQLTYEIVDDGYDIYVPSRAGYRYGPSIIYYEDGSMDAWFASNGNNSTEWDWITYRHYDGENWSDEKIVLRPTKRSRDHYSACDPGVIYFNGYYYLGYTSTENETKGGVENNLFVARSLNPDGPFEKWNGEGWGGKPKPIIEYQENDEGWGIGEVSFVIVDDRLYCYYTYIDGQNNFYTKLAISNLVDDWPLYMQDQGSVITRVNSQGSFDFVYNDLFNKFIGFCIEGSFDKNSSIAIYESDNGIDFIQTQTIKTNVSDYAHNIGVSKMIDGHINIDDDLCIGYAYSKGKISVWGRWASKIQSIKIKGICK